MTYLWSSRFRSQSIAADSSAPRSKATMACLASGLAAMSALLASPAHAVTTTIDFVGTAPYVQGYYYGLTNSLTGTDTLPALAVEAGDIFQGTLSFASSVTVPNNSYFGLQLAINDTSGIFTDYISYAATLSYFYGATEVTPVGIGTYGGSTQGLVIGNYNFTGTGAFSFDRIEYSVMINYFFDQDNQIQYDSSVLPESNSSFYLGVIPTSNVPEPASWAMMLAGFSLVGATLRNRRTVRLSFAR